MTAKVNSQTWESLGSPFSGNYIYGNVSLSSNGDDLYFLHRYDDGVNYRGKVMKYSNNSWSSFGTDFVSQPNYGVQYSLNFNLTSLNEVYSTYSNLSGAVVKKYNAGNWSTEGNNYFVIPEGTFDYNNAMIKFDSNNVPYMALTEDGGSYKVSVMKLNGGSWGYVGASKFSTCGNHQTLSFEIAQNNTPYVVYDDCVLVGGSYVYRVLAKKFDGSSWVPVGSGIVSESSSNNASLAIGSDNLPYVAYRDNAQSGKLTVKKFDGTNWVLIGSAGFTSSTVEKINLKLDSANHPVVGFKDNGNAGKATVMKFDGLSWNAVGTPGFSIGSISELVMDLKADRIAVCYKDINGYNIKKLNISLSNASFTLNDKVSIYPNPVKDIINVELKENTIAKVEIVTLEGKKVADSNDNSINISGLSRGVYLVKVLSTSGETGIKKIIK